MVDADVESRRHREGQAADADDRRSAEAQARPTSAPTRSRRALEQLGLAVPRSAGVAALGRELVRFLTHPMVSSLLISVGMLGILVEMRTPGFGVAGGLGIGQPRAVLLGPLAGAAGRLGGAAAGGRAGWRCWRPRSSSSRLRHRRGAGHRGPAGCAGAEHDRAGDTAPCSWRRVARRHRAAGGLLAAWCCCASAAPALRAPAGAGDRPGHRGRLWLGAAESDQRWLGKQGMRASPLRPAGIADIEGERVDVVSDGALIEPASPSR
jgi:membrane-bound serine protease (ClpP class)